MQHRSYRDGEDYRYPGGLRPVGQEPSRGRLGDEAEEQGRQGDAELGPREVGGEVPQQRPHAACPRVRVGCRLDTDPVDGHQAELGGHKERVDGQEQGDRHQPDEDGHLGSDPNDDRP